MKRVLSLMLIIILYLSGCSSTIKNETSLPFESTESYKSLSNITAEEIEAIEKLKTEHERFTYGALLTSEAFVLENGEYEGFSKRFCEFLSSFFGIEFVLELYERDELINRLTDGSVDFSGEISPTEEWSHSFYITSPIAERTLSVYSNVSDRKIYDGDDLNGYEIGFLEGSSIAEEIRKLYSVPFTEVSVENYQTAKKWLKSGNIDAFIDYSAVDPIFAEDNYIQATPVFPMIYAPMSIGTSKFELSPIISVAGKLAESIATEESDEFYRNMKDEYTKYKLSKRFTEEEKAYISDLIQQGESVSVAFEKDNYPVSFYNEKEGKYAGIAIDILEEIEKLTGLNFSPADSKNVIWEQMLDSILSGETKMAAQLLYSNERAENFVWTNIPYAISYYAILSKADYPETAPHQVGRVRVGAVKKSGKIEIYKSLFPGNDNLILYNSQSDSLDALENGEVDLLMASEYTLLMLTNYREKSGYKINIKPDILLESRFGFGKDEKLLCSIVDKAQQYVATDVIEINWTGRSFDYSIKLSQQRFFYMLTLVIIMFFVLGLITSILIKNVKLSKKLKDIAGHDSLTGILNRRSFLEQASIQSVRSTRLGSKCCIAIYDLDFFKDVNDKYGHIAGDRVLIETTQRVKNTLRPYDLFGRYGGEEFIIYISDMEESASFDVFERIRGEICNNPIEFDKKSISVSASFGVSYTENADDLSAAIKQADEALYRAKENGRNRVEFY